MDDKYLEETNTILLGNQCPPRAKCSDDKKWADFFFYLPDMMSPTLVAAYQEMLSAGMGYATENERHE